MPFHSRKALAQMGVVLLVLVAAACTISVLRWSTVQAIYFPDLKTILLNGAIVLLFLLGLLQLWRGLSHYAQEEQHIADYLDGRAAGLDSEVLLTGSKASSLVAQRYATIKDLFNRGVPINHGAIAAVMVAEESLFQSFPRFVNNVLILTGVFGTVTSLIFALVGASNVLQTALPGEGMGVMLLGMNTALTTTATAIVCYFFFTYFYQKLSDVQTHVLGRVEQAVLMHVIPEFAFDSESINHQTQALIHEVRGLVGGVETSLGKIEGALDSLVEQQRRQSDALTELGTSRQDQSRFADQIAGTLAELRELLIEGFRLGR